MHVAERMSSCILQHKMGRVRGKSNYLSHVRNDIPVDFFKPDLFQVVHPAASAHVEPEIPVVIERSQEPQDEQDDAPRLAVHYVREWPAQTGWYA